jgi:hypothetical protein
MPELLGAAKRREFDAVFVLNVSRLSRSSLEAAEVTNGSRRQESTS